MSEVRMVNVCAQCGTDGSTQYICFARELYLMKGRLRTYALKVCIVMLSIQEIIKWFRFNVKVQVTNQNIKENCSAAMLTEKHEKSRAMSN